MRPQGVFSIFSRAVSLKIQYWVSICDWLGSFQKYMNSLKYHIVVLRILNTPQEICMPVVVLLVQYPWSVQFFWITSMTKATSCTFNVTPRNYMQQTLLAVLTLVENQRTHRVCTTLQNIRNTTNHFKFSCTCMKDPGRNVFCSPTGRHHLSTKTYRLRFAGANTYMKEKTNKKKNHKD